MEKKKTFSYKEQYAVIVICSGEKEQKKMYEELKKQGLTLKIVSVTTQVSLFDSDSKAVAMLFCLFPEKTYPKWPILLIEYYLCRA